VTDEVGKMTDEAETIAGKVENVTDEKGKMTGA
jgi:hypothetical protein